METDKSQKKKIQDEWHKDTSNWRLGVFYFNKADKRIFPPKRYPYLGWTINFANPWSVLTLAAMIILIILLALYLAKIQP
jgi:uncharacterized membrane protein